jgi:hypothetical protein
MPLLRLAYSALYLLALIAVFVAWGQIGGTGHLEVLPWYIKGALGASGAFTIVRATAAAVAGERAWNPQCLRWLGLTLVLAVCCGLASYYSHMYLEDTGDEDDQGDTSVSVYRANGTITVRAAAATATPSGSATWQSR